MASLWTDLVTPAELTGYTRASLQAYENSKGSLSDFLPNKTVAGINVRVTRTESGLVETAKFRSYDAELERGATTGGDRMTLELPALGKAFVVSEYDQLMLRNADNEELRNAIFTTADTAAQAAVDAMEYQRGQALTTGRFVVNQNNYKVSDDFRRDTSMSVTSGNLWNTSSAKILDDLIAWVNTYMDVNNGTEPGTLLVSNKIFQTILKADEFKPYLNTARRATRSDVQAIFADNGIPKIRVYDRRVNLNGTTTRTTAEDRVYMLPAEGDSALGATFWGTTLTATEEGWGLAGTEKAGIVAGVYKNSKPPIIAEVISDAIGMPVLANANLAFTAKVL